ncbi:hypothetical protein PoB_005807500 [Plakobranchus ocellatus]|uniref:Uncharacterized protein n=1 Tax=Plakobranchus ocellatus TaxID=259542 RepID=A0AAV4CFG6_9GAST|nr:hypothetical protein PoB_005807500 [Plakobranchus ocellatus]
MTASVLEWSLVVSASLRHRRLEGGDRPLKVACQVVEVLIDFLPRECSKETDMPDFTDLTSRADLAKETPKKGHAIEEEEEEVCYLYLGLLPAYNDASQALMSKDTNQFTA